MAYYKSGGINVTSNSNVSINTASGSIASFNTNLSMPVLETKATINPVQDGTPWIDSNVVNKVPYIKRAVVGTATRIGNHLFDKLVGGTVAWNQIRTNGNFTATTGWNSTNSTRSVLNNIMTLTASSTASEIELYDASTNRMEVVENHIYFTSYKVKSNVAITKMHHRGFIVKNNTSGFSANTENTIEIIGQATANKMQNLYFYGEFNTSDTINIKEIVCFDLTAMFGSTIANYIYSLEQATAGAGVAWFKALFPNDYYAYNAGELLSVKTSAHKMVGKNLFDKTDNTIENNVRIATSTGGTYGASGYSVSPYIRVDSSKPYVLTSGIQSYFAGYDENKTFIGGGTWNDKASKNLLNTVEYVRFDFQTSGKDIVQIEQGSTATAYEPYKANVYALDSDLELRGLPKLDSNNNLYYDGDTYSSNGSVVRKYAIVDLGSLTWATAVTADPNKTRFKATLNNAKKSDVTVGVRSICSYKYIALAAGNTYYPKEGYTITDDNALYIFDENYATATKEQFKTAMSGIYLVYELATPTEETADPFTNPQVCDENGTEEYVDNRTIPIPVGHETYQANICPITGFDELNIQQCGVNLWDEEWEVGNWNIADGTKGTLSDRIRCKNLIPVPANTTLYLCIPSGMSARVGGYKADGTYIGQIIADSAVTARSFTPPSDCAYINFNLLNTYGTTYNNDISINYPATDTTYHAYNTASTTYAVSWQTEAGTVYGGNLDLTTGVLTVNYAYVDVGSIEWTRKTDGAIPYFRHDFTDSTLTQLNRNFKCSHYQNVPFATIYSSGQDKSAASYTNGILIISDTDYSDAQSFQTGNVGTQLIYELATPATYQLTPVQINALLGVNNIWHDANGNTEVKYRKVNIQ
jgi:hypothetical protein